MRKHWERYLRVATWLAVVVGAFLVPPPATLVTEPNRTAAYVVFAVAVAYAAVYQAYRRTLQARSRRVRALLVGGCLAVSAVAFLGYDHLVAEWTALCSDGKSRLIIGAELKPEASAQLREAGVPLEHKDEILSRAQNTVAEAWNVADVPRRRLILNLLYIASGLAGAFCILLAVDAPIPAAKPAARRLTRKKANVVAP